MFLVKKYTNRIKLSCFMSLPLRSRCMAATFHKQDLEACCADLARSSTEAQLLQCIAMLKAQWNLKPISSQGEGTTSSVAPARWISRQEITCVCSSRSARIRQDPQGSARIRKGANFSANSTTIFDDHTMTI